jgi:hypothetical protein
VVADNDSSAAATLVYAPLLTCAMWALPLLQTPSSTMMSRLYSRSLSVVFHEEPPASQAPHTDAEGTMCVVCFVGWPRDV